MKIHRLASKEVHEAAGYYERQQFGLGARFLKAVEAGYDLIERNPTRHTIVDGNIRHYLMPIFPYYIVFLPHDRLVTVIAVMHVKRRPNYWRYRLKTIPE